MADAQSRFAGGAGDVTRLGLGVGFDGCRAVMRRGRTIVWEAEELCGPEESVAATIPRLLARVPCGRVWRPRVVAAIGPTFVQLRQITGLPVGVSDSRVLSAVVCANASRFFVTRAAPIRLALVVAGAGRCWAAAFDSRLVEAVSVACRRAGLRLDGCIPAAWALSASREDGHHRWYDGDIVVELVVAGGTLLRVRRRRRVDGATVGGCAGAYSAMHELQRGADAYAAAETNRDIGLLVRVNAARDGGPRVLRVVLATLCVASALACLVIPFVVAHNARQRAEQRLAEVAGQATAASRALDELRTTTTALNEISRFANSRRSMLLLLGELTRMLPESTSLVALRADSSGGTFVALTTSPHAVLSRLRTGRIEAPQLAGPITPEIIDGQELQRLPFRFRFQRAARVR